MDRREVLKYGLAVAAGSAITTPTADAHAAEAEDIVKEMLHKRPWLELATYRRLRYLTGALADLRIAYSGPNGYEGQEKFASSVWLARNQALGKTAKAGHGIAVDVLAPTLDKYAADLEGQMNDMLKKNGDKFKAWLVKVGVGMGTTLQNDFLRAQTLFGIGASVLIGKLDLGSFKDDTWVYPFC